jgi:hypothetical protein
VQGERHWLLVLEGYAQFGRVNIFYQRSNLHRSELRLRLTEQPSLSIVAFPKRVAMRIMHVPTFRQNKQQKNERREQEADEHPVPRMAVLRPRDKGCDQPRHERGGEIDRHQLSGIHGSTPRLSALGRDVPLAKLAGISAAKECICESHRPPIGGPGSRPFKVRLSGAAP